MRRPTLLPLYLAAVVSPLAPPGARAQRGPRVEEAKGPAAVAPATDTLTIESRILGRGRRVFVGLPESWAHTERAYPVVIVLDGEAYFDAATSLEATLARLGHVPEAIVVAVPNASDDPRDRVHDMTPPGLAVSGSGLRAGGDDFLDFLEREVLPEIDRRYRGGLPRTLVGHSSGGVIATYAAATRSDVFPVVVSLDAPIHLGDGWLADRLVERAERGGDAPVRYVALESRFGWPDERWEELRAAAPPSWLLRRERLEGESHESMGFLGLYQGLKFAFSDYSIVGAPFFPRGTALGVFEHFERIERTFGAPLPPPARVLRRLVEDLLTQGMVEPARKALAWLVEGYGPQQDEPELRARIERVRALLPLEETVASLKSSPWPTPEEIAPYVGEWQGEQGPDLQAGQPFTLRVGVVDGRVVAETEMPLGARLDVRAAEYLRVRPDGLEFGYMNGMRPAGMIVYGGRLEGDTLRGEMSLRGIVLLTPPGMRPPRVYFRLTRR